MTDQVTVDTSKLTADVKALAAGLDRVARSAPDRAASDVATRLRSRLPRRTGRLVDSVRTVDVTNGTAVSYGTGVPYAAYIDRRTGAVDAALVGADAAFVGACETGAATEVSRI